MTTLYEDLKRLILRDYGVTNDILTHFCQLHGFASQKLIYDFCTKKETDVQKIAEFVTALKSINGLETDIAPFLKFAQDVYSETDHMENKALEEALFSTGAYKI